MFNEAEGVLTDASRGEQLWSKERHLAVGVERLQNVGSEGHGHRCDRARSTKWTNGYNARPRLCPLCDQLAVSYRGATGWRLRVIIPLQ